MGRDRELKFRKYRHFKIELVSRFAAGYLAVNRCLEAFEEQIALVDTKGWNLEQTIYAFFQAKSYKTIWAIDTLLREGCGEDAGSLLRTLLENLINCLYISEDPGERAELYAEYEYVGAYRAHQSITKLNALNPQEPAYVVPDAQIEEINREYERLRKRYPKRTSWSGKTVEDMAVEVGLEDLYLLFYRYHSDQIHGSSPAARAFLQEDADGGLGIRLGPNYNEIRHVITGTCHVGVRLLRFFSERLPMIDPEAALARFADAKRDIEHLLVQQRRGSS